MQWRNSSAGYGAVAKFLHWSIVILIIAQYVIIEAADELPDGPDKLAGIAKHKSIGMLILGLALVRSAWNLLNGAQPAPAPMPRAQRIAAAAGHRLLYVPETVSRVKQYIPRQELVARFLELRLRFYEALAAKYPKHAGSLYGWRMRVLRLAEEAGNWRVLWKGL